MAKVTVPAGIKAKMPKPTTKTPKLTNYAKAPAAPTVPPTTMGAAMQQAQPLKIKLPKPPKPRATPTNPTVVKTK